MPTAPGLMKLLVRVRPDKHVLFAGSRRRAAAMVVSNYPSVFRITLLMDIVSFQVAVARPSKRSQSLRFSHLESARHIRPQIPPLSDESRYWTMTSTPLSQAESATSPPLALLKCDSTVSWSLLVLPLLPLGQRGNRHVPPRPTGRRICVSCLSVSDRS